MTDTIKIARKGAKRLRGGHLWAYQREVYDASSGMTPGTVVHALDESGRFIGQGFFNPNTAIAFRLFTRREEAVDRPFWAARLARAHQLRALINVPETTALRLVHAEADGIPGLIVDRYGDLLVVQMLTAGIERNEALWVELLLEAFRPKAILARNDQKARKLEGLTVEKKVLFGERPETLEVLENGLRFTIDPWNGQKTGAYLDQRENRLAARAYARGRVLDGFCYQGWFGINCAAGAAEVIAVDSSAPALEMALRNAEANGVENVSVVHTNVFDYLYAADKANERFELIVLDPPAFAKSRQTIESGMHGYKEINLRAMRLLKEGGVLVTSSCSYHLSEEKFLGVIENAARDGGRTIQILEKRTQGRDHPILLSHPESYYLKCFVLRVL